MLIVQNLTKTYHLYKNPKDRLKEALSLSKKKYHKEFYALKNVSFNIQQGEVVGIIGTNGSGKSTLLKIITAVLTPTSGEVNIDGKITALLELGAGFNPELTGLQNIYLHGTIAGYTKKQMSEKLQEITKFAQIGEFLHQAVKTYSSGMKSRLAFSLAINVDPEILIIDEVLSVGDAAFQRKCFAKIESFKEQGKTILFVSHSASQVINLCSRAIWLSRGEKVIEGESKIVMGLYQKYSSDKALDFANIQKEFLEKTANTDEKKNATQRETQREKKLEKSTMFNPSMKPKSTIYYKENGAKITNVKLLDMQEQECNIIEKGLEYYYSYDVVFERVFHDVNLAMLIKTKNGIEIGGAQIPLIKGEIVENIIAGKTYRIKWKFKNRLNSGSYFFNCGVNTIINDEKIVLHRVLDAYMFEVLPKKSDYSNNIVDFEFSLGVTL